MFDETNLDWAPSVGLGQDSVRTVSVERYHRAEQKGRRKRQPEIEDSDGIPPVGEDEEVDSIEPVVEEVCESMEESETTTDSTKTVQTLMTMNDVENLEELKEQHRSLCREV